MTSSGKGGGGLQPHLSQEPQHGGSARYRHNHTMEGECTSHPGHDDGSTVNGGAMTGY
jgi:hypothetical protein